MTVYVCKCGRPAEWLLDEGGLASASCPEHLSATTTAHIRRLAVSGRVSLEGGLSTRIRWVGGGGVPVALSATPPPALSRRRLLTKAAS